MTTLTELGPAGVVRASSFVEDAILAICRFFRGFEFMVGMAALFAWTLIDAGAPDGWPFGARAGAGLFLLLVPKKPRRPMGFNRCGAGLLSPAKIANRRPTHTGVGAHSLGRDFR
jgi:hypothetical protein